MVRVPPSGTWERRRADLYGLSDPWLVGPSPSELEARQQLIAIYLAAFGPSAPGDIASWTGIPITALRPALAHMRLSEVEFEDGTPLLDLPGAPVPDADAPAPPRFLGNWEAVLLAHVRRAEVLPERFRKAHLSHQEAPVGRDFLVAAVAGVVEDRRTAGCAHAL